MNTVKIFIQLETGQAIELETSAKRATLSLVGPVRFLRKMGTTPDRMVGLKKHEAAALALALESWATDGSGLTARQPVPTEKP